MSLIKKNAAVHDYCSKHRTMHMNTFKLYNSLKKSYKKRKEK